MSDETTTKEMTEVVIEGLYINAFFNSRQCNTFPAFFRSDYDKKENYKSSGTSGYRQHHYESDDNSDSGGNNNSSAEPNNKVIVRGLAQHITEADVS